MDFFQVKYEAHKDVVIALVGFPSGLLFAYMWLGETIPFHVIDHSFSVFIRYRALATTSSQGLDMACGWPLVNLMLLVACWGSYSTNLLKDTHYSKGEDYIFEGFFPGSGTVWFFNMLARAAQLFPTVLEKHILTKDAKAYLCTFFRSKNSKKPLVSFKLSALRRRLPVLCFWLIVTLGNILL